MTPETKAKAVVQKLFAECAKEFGFSYTRDVNAAGGYGSAKGMPDTVYHVRPQGSTHCITVKLEVKAGNNTATKLQASHLKAYHNIGGHGLVIWGDHAADIEWLRGFLATLSAASPTLKLTKA